MTDVADHHAPAAPTTAPRSERLLILAAALAALLSWISVEISGNGAVGVLLFTGCFAVLSAVAPGLRLHTGAARDVAATATPGEQVEAQAAPGKPVWYLPFLLLPIMLLTSPIAYAATSFHNTILGLAAACALLGGSIGTIVGSRLWSAVVVAVSVAPAALDDTGVRVSTRVGVVTSVVLGVVLAVATVVGAVLV